MCKYLIDLWVYHRLPCQPNQWAINKLLRIKLNVQNQDQIWIKRFNKTIHIRMQIKLLQQLRDEQRIHLLPGVVASLTHHQSWLKTRQAGTKLLTIITDPSSQMIIQTHRVICKHSKGRNRTQDNSWVLEQTYSNSSQEEDVSSTQSQIQTRTRCHIYKCSASRIIIIMNSF